MLKCPVSCEMRKDGIPVSSMQQVFTEHLFLPVPVSCTQNPMKAPPPCEPSPGQLVLGIPAHGVGTSWCVNGAGSGGAGG